MHSHSNSSNNLYVCTYSLGSRASRRIMAGLLVPAWSRSRSTRSRVRVQEFRSAGSGCRVEEKNEKWVWVRGIRQGKNVKVKR